MKIKKTHDLIMLIGLPGSGKSTYKTNFLKNFPDFISLSTDDMIDKWGEENGKNYSEAFKILTENKGSDVPSLKNFEKKMFEDLKYHMEIGNSVIIDRTNMSANGRKKILVLVPSNYKKTAVVFKVKDEELARRLEKREQETGKHIPAFVLNMMKKNYQEPSSEEFDKIAYIDDED